MSVRETVKKSGTLIYLEASERSLHERLESTADSRPLLAGLSPSEREQKINSMLASRRPIYEQAELRIATDNRAPEQIAHEILESLGRSEK